MRSGLDGENGGQHEKKEARFAGEVSNKRHPLQEKETLMLTANNFVVVYVYHFSTLCRMDC